MRTHRHVRWFRALSALISLMLLLTSLSSLTPTTLAVSTSHMPNPSTDNIRDDFDPTFSSPSYPVHTIQSPIDLSFPPNAGNWAPPVTTEITLPPGSYHQQLTADVTLSGDNIAVAKVALFSAGSDRWEEAVLAEKQGAGVVHHTGTVSLGFFAVPQETPLTLKLRCYKGSTDDTASCSFRNLRLTDAVPGWVELESAPTNLAHTTVGTHIGDIVADPQHGSFLGFTINSSGSRRATYRSPPLTFPTIKRTDVVTASVRWARHTKDSNPVYNASGAEIRFVTTTGRAAGLVSIPRLDIPTRDPIDMLEGWTNTTQTHSTRRLRGVSGETGSIEVMKWGGSTDHTFALDDLQLYINGEPVWTRADQPFLDLTVTDSASQSVEALALNSDGWPAINAATGAAANPITVTVTFDPSETERDFDTLRLWIGSEDTEQRFYTGFAGEQDVDCFPPGIIAHDSSQYSYEEYVLRCDLFYAVSPNVRTIQRQIWVQPSTATVLPITATLIDLESGTEVTARVDVDIPEAAIHPLVFLPGLGATIPPVYDSNPDDTLWIGDMIADYGTFYENLEKMGYERDVTYFRFPYDWLRSTIETSSHLWTKLDTWDNIAAQVPWVHSDGGDANTVTFDLVGHSTGNLVVRAYVQGPEWRSTRDNVRRWVSIAGPLQGVPKAYRGFEGLNPDLGKLEDGFPLLFAGLDAWIFQRAHQAGYTIPIDETNVTLTTQNKYLFVHDPENGLTILPEFLPTYGDYFFDGDNNPNPYGRLANPLLEDSSVVNGTLDDARNGTMEGKVFDPYLGNPHLFNTTIYEKPIPPGFQTTYRGLNTPAKMALLESRIGADNICVVYGGATENVTNPTDTPEGIRVSEPQTIAPYWLNGIRVRDIQTSGDGLITETSADLKNIWTVEVPSENTFEIENVLERQSDHTNIVGEQLSISATTQCLSQLKAPFLTKHYPRPGTTTAPKAPLPPAIASTPSSTAPIQSLLLYAPGPVDLLLTNAQGQRLGYDTDSGTILKEIPDAVYYQDNNEQAAYLFVYGADLGDYEVTVTGTAVGDYEVIGWYEDDTATVNLVYEEGTASVGSTAQIDLELPTDTRDVPTPPRVQTGPDFQVMVGEIARFTGYLSDINPQDTHTISWDFGDQNKVDGTLTPEHTYIATGQYTATLTITDSTNLVASDIVRV
ncbi:MAG: PKD domain-containing protein, partial [Chloroflexota bacterium]